MPTIQCPDCDRQISESAPSCPGCGRPMALTAYEGLTDRPYSRRSRFSIASLIKRMMIVLFLIAAAWYVATMWAADKSFQATSEKLGREMGLSVVAELGRMNASCQASSDLDSVSAKTDGLFSKTGSVSIYILGANNRSVSLDYRSEIAGDRVYLKPKNHQSAMLLLTQFSVSGCR